MSIADAVLAHGTPAYPCLGGIPTGFVKILHLHVKFILSFVHEMPHLMDYTLSEGTIRSETICLRTHYSNSMRESIEKDLPGRFLEQRLYGGFVEVRHSSTREVC